MNQCKSNNTKYHMQDEHIQTKNLTYSAQQCADKPRDEHLTYYYSSNDIFVYIYQ